MSILTGPEIARLVESGALAIDPFDPKAVNPNSYDVTLAPSLLVYRANVEYLRWWEGLLTLPFPASASSLGRALLEADGEQPHAHLPRDVVLDARRANETVDLVIPEAGLVLVPGVLYLGCTNETVGAAYPYVAMLEGKSSLGRLGLSVHVTAGFGDTGHRARWTYELSVVSPLRVYPDMRVAQMGFFRVEGARLDYAGRYQGDTGPVASRYHVDSPST